jgi:hypothetical protein
MRTLVAAGIGAAALVIAGAAGAQAGSWTYAYANGTATATERNEDGRVTATIACQPPTGDIILSDFTLAREARRARTASVRIGNMSVNVPVRAEGRGRNRAAVIALPQRPPILAAVQPDDRITVTINGESRTMGAGSATKMKEVAYACWGS